MPNRFARNEIDYIIWQNRAYRFYVPARLLFHRGYWSAAAFTAYQALEALLKATVVYRNPNFVPRDAGHDLEKLTKLVNDGNNPGESPVSAPTYYERYQVVPRYPDEGRGFVVRLELIEDLDELFADLVCRIPFQFNSLLWSDLGEGNPDLADNNNYYERLKTQCPS